LGRSEKSSRRLVTEKLRERDATKKEKGSATGKVEESKTLLTLSKWGGGGKINLYTKDHEVRRAGNETSTGEVPWGREGKGNLAERKKKKI